MILVLFKALLRTYLLYYYLYIIYIYIMTPLNLDQ
jgi:hypothetical protein